MLTFRGAEQSGDTFSEQNQLSFLWEVGQLRGWTLALKAVGISFHWVLSSFERQRTEAFGKRAVGKTLSFWGAAECSSVQLGGCMLGILSFEEMDTARGLADEQA